MNLLIIGGTAYFGTDIVELALKAGHTVTICSRGNARPLFWDRVSHIAVDRTDTQNFTKALRGKSFDAVIDNIAYTAEEVGNALAVFKGNIGRYILTTSAVVYMTANSFDHPLREDEVNLEITITPHSPDPWLEGLVKYANNKVAAEKALFAQSDVPYTILRPHFVAGPEDRLSFARFYFQRLLDGQPLILTNGGCQPFQPIYRRDLAKAFILALTSDQAINQAYSIAQTSACPLVDWVKLAAKCLGLKPKLVHVPDKVLHAANFKYAELFTDNNITVDISKAQTQLGFQPTRLETWTATTCKWYQGTEYSDDAPGYADREKETELAERFRAKLPLAGD